MGPYLARQGVTGSNSSKIRMYVASDQENGIRAFEHAFGTQSVMKLPSEMPIEHAVDCTRQGAIRIYADLLILSKADFLLGSCGSTFTNVASQLSGRPSTFVVTGTPEAMQCASMANQPRDLSGFAYENFGGPTEACSCYAAGEAR